MGFIRWPLLLLVFAGYGLHSQEIRYIELSSAEQRTELRHPLVCGEEVLWCGKRGSSVVDAPPEKPGRALGVYLLRVTPSDINPLEMFEAEFKVLNTGQVSLELPVSKDLSDLQPNDESADFHYFELSLVVFIQPEPQGPDAHGIGSISLYGSTGRDGSMIVLRPGEWIRVKARMKLHTWPSAPVFAQFQGRFFLRSILFHPNPGEGFTEVQRLYPNETSSPSIVVHLLGSGHSASPNH
jgi:hypothetical protein